MYSCLRGLYFLLSQTTISSMLMMHVPSSVLLAGLWLTPTIAALGHPHVHIRRDLKVSNTLPVAWSYLGCYTDSVQARGLDSDGFAEKGMTEGKCIGFCDQRGYSHAAVEYGQECRCGYDVKSPSILTKDSECNFPCSGASSESCGGSNRMNIFTNVVPLAIENPGVNGYKSLGCYTDSQTARTLSTYIPIDDGIVFVRGCTNICARRGFAYAGVEYGRECFCGAEIKASGVASLPESCNMPCTGNRTEVCGGSDRINLYSSLGSADQAEKPRQSPASASSISTSVQSSTLSSPSPYGKGDHSQSVSRNTNSNGSGLMRSTTCTG